MRPHPALSGTPHRGIWWPIGLGTLLRLIQIWMPVLGVHSWRQADTAAMARHFSQNSTPIWLPQIDWGGATSGLVESEFPIYPFVVSRMYGLFGVQEWLGRGLSALFSGLTIWLIIRLGRRWFNPTAGWWAGLAFAIAPLGVYFGRTFQAEALLLLCAAAALDSLSLWRQHRSRWALALSWLCLTTAGLIKVIPLLWLGLPLLMVQLTPDPHARAEPSRTLLHRSTRLLCSPWFWLYVGTSLATVAAWYFHAHQLGQSSGLSFGFWGAGADRSSASLLLDVNSWINLLLRVVVRLLAVMGLPFLLIGLQKSWRTGGGQIAISGLVGVLLCTLATMRSSTIHEYYQLPLLLFSSPLVGLGWQCWQPQRPRWQPRVVLGLALVVSLTVLSVDYWVVEQRQSRAWMPLALTIRNQLPTTARIVSVTSTDPTLLNLARRQGWLISSKQLTPERLQRWQAAGATHLAGSFLWDKTYRPMPEQRQLRLKQLAATSPNAWIDQPSQAYLIPIDDLQPQP